MKKILILLLVVLIIGCTPKVQIVDLNHTIKEIYIINNTQECIVPDCVCNYPLQRECKETICDVGPLKKCQLQVGRLVGEVNYIKNLTHIQLTNASYQVLKNNLTNCTIENNNLLDKLRKINETMQ